MGDTNINLTGLLVGLNEIMLINSLAYCKGPRIFSSLPYLIYLFDAPSLFQVEVFYHFNTLARLALPSLKQSSKLYSFSPQSFAQLRSGPRTIDTPFPTQPELLGTTALASAGPVAFSLTPPSPTRLFKQVNLGRRY